MYKKYKTIDKEAANLLFKLNSLKFSIINESDHYDGSVGHDLLCRKQSDYLNKNGLIWVINTSILHLYDEYGPVK